MATCGLLAARAPAPRCSRSGARTDRHRHVVEGAHATRGPSYDAANYDKSYCEKFKAKGATRAGDFAARPTDPRRHPLTPGASLFEFGDTLMDEFPLEAPVTAPLNVTPPAPDSPAMMDTLLATFSPKGPASGGSSNRGFLESFTATFQKPSEETQKL